MAEALLKEARMKRELKNIQKGDPDVETRSKRNRPVKSRDKRNRDRTVFKIEQMMKTNGYDRRDLKHKVKQMKMAKKKKERAKKLKLDARARKIERFKATLRSKSSGQRGPPSIDSSRAQTIQDVIRKIRLKGVSGKDFMNGKKDKNGIPDYASLTKERKIAVGREFDMMLSKLRSQWKKYEIPGYETDDLRERHIKYYAMCDMLEEESMKIKYRNIVIISWAVVEILCTHVFKLVNLDGYTKCQMDNIAFFEYLLSEKRSMGDVDPVVKATKTWSTPAKIAGHSVATLITIAVVNIIGKYAGPGITKIILNFVKGSISSNPTEKESEDSPDINIRQPPTQPRSSGVVDNLARNVSSITNGVSSIFNLGGDKKEDKKDSQTPTTHRAPAFAD